MENLSSEQRVQFQHLITAAYDDELSSQERESFDYFLATYPECAQEWERMQALQQITKTMKFKAPPKEVWDMYWLNTYNRIERGLAWILFSLGAILLGSYAIYNFIAELISDTHLPIVVRTGLITLVIGGVALFVSVVREKLFTRKNDPYKEVER